MPRVRVVMEEDGKTRADYPFGMLTQEESDSLHKIIREELKKIQRRS